MTIPAVPVDDTPDPNPLLTLTGYQQVTGDTSTDSGAFTATLADALDELQRETRRTLLYAQYTERLYVYRNGMVYPTATPLDTTKAVNNPGADPPENVGIFQGNGIWVGWFVPLPSLPIWQGVVPAQTDITYWGGYTGTDGPGPYLPAALKRVIAKVCWYMLHPVTLSGLPGGVKSASVGGVSMSGDLSAMVDRDPALARDIRRWRHPQAKAWDGQTA
jgi:hypothetical protein